MLLLRKYHRQNIANSVRQNLTKRFVMNVQTNFMPLLRNVIRIVQTVRPPRVGGCLSETVLSFNRSLAFLICDCHKDKCPYLVVYTKQKTC